MGNKNENLERKTEKNWKDGIPCYGLFRYGLTKPLGEDRYDGNELYYSIYISLIK